MPFRFNPLTHKLDLVEIGGVAPGVLEFLTGDTGGPIAPDGAHNINLFGGTGITTSGAGNTITISESPPSGMVFLFSQTATNVSSVVFDATYITATYSKYCLLVDNVTLNAATPSLTLQLSVDDGANYLATGFVNNVSSSTASFFLSDDGNNFDNTVPLSGVYNLQNMNLNSYPFINGYFSYSKNGTAVTTSLTAGRGPANSTVNNIKIEELSGNILTGNFSLYGYRS